MLQAALDQSLGVLAIQDPNTAREAIAHGTAELIRALDDRQTFALLVDRLPHAIEAGCAGMFIALLKMWGAWHDLYPLDRAEQAMLQDVHNNAGPVDSRSPSAPTS